MRTKLMNTLPMVFALVLGTSLLGASGCCGNGVCWHRVGPGLIHWQNQPCITCAPVNPHPVHYPTHWQLWSHSPLDYEQEAVEAIGAPLPTLPPPTGDELPEPDANAFEGAAEMPLE